MKDHLKSGYCLEFYVGTELVLHQKVERRLFIILVIIVSRERHLHRLHFDCLLCCLLVIDHKSL